MICVLEGPRPREQGWSSFARNLQAFLVKVERKGEEPNGSPMVCNSTSLCLPASSKKQTPLCQEVLVNSATVLRKITLDEEGSNWEHRMVLKVDKVVRDWTKVLNTVAERLGVDKCYFVLMWFSLFFLSPFFNLFLVNKCYFVLLDENPP
uniref:Uncharacterized protein n=1 Tax=Nelumbo nucifera TaxID=4432 RepID=A0A822ZMU3_NELNU|nr:TPA_asm: hypothetical protein HUJ06_004020 [Nelumbo nucifera]